METSTEWLVEYHDGMPAFTGTYDECIAWIEARHIDVTTVYAAAKKIVVGA